MRSFLLFLGRFFYLVAFTCGSHAIRMGRGSDTPQDVLRLALKRNRSVSRVRKALIQTSIMSDPRLAPHPEMLVVACMDGRIQMHTLFGDPRLNMDVLRMPGSVTTEQVMVEAIALSIIAHNVKLVLILDHTDCAMLKVAHDHKHPLHGQLRCLVNSVHTDSAVFLSRLNQYSQSAYERFLQGEVIIARGLLDTSTGEIRDVVQYEIKETLDDPIAAQDPRQVVNL